MDIATAQAILQLQAQDVENLISSQKGKQRQRNLSDSELALSLWQAEFRNAIGGLHDRRIARSLSQACTNDRQAIAVALHEEQTASQDHELACRMGGVPVVQRSAAQSAPQTNLDDCTSSRYAAVNGVGRTHSRRTNDALLSAFRLLGQYENTHSDAINQSQPLADSSTKKRECRLPSMPEGTPAKRIKIAHGDAAERAHAPSAFAVGPTTVSTIPNATASQPRAVEQSVTLKKACNAYLEDKPSTDVIEAPCKDIYCRDCVVSLFTASTTDEALFPPRCCRKRIPLEAVRRFLPSDLQRLFAEKAVEYTTPNRTYCHQPACSTFIAPRYIAGNVAACPKCRFRTCTTCKGAAHRDECPQDPAFQALLEIARTEEWQRCYNCTRLVELTIGCNHMRCPCKAHFCYECGARWKTCECPQWREDRLVEAAERRARRDNQEIDAARQHLIDRHDCAHDADWNQVFPRPAVCELCNDQLHWLLECSHCGIRMCRDCRDDREWENDSEDGSDYGDDGAEWDDQQWNQWDQQWAQWDQQWAQWDRQWNQQWNQGNQWNRWNG